MYVRVCICMYMCMCVYVCLCVCVYMCLHIYDCRFGSKYMFACRSEFDVSLIIMICGNHYFKLITRTNRWGVHLGNVLINALHAHKL